ncbi:MAG TPA: MFS transporter [Acidimicrobiia bacterium]|nr:MFS transporter [Acidimicrobiia bacterium]
MPGRRSEIGFVVTLTLGMAVCTFLPYALGALGPFITDDLGITHTALGSLTTVMYAVGAVLSPVAGPLVDRFGGRRSLLVSFAAGGLGVAVAAAAGRHYSGLVAGAAVFGVSVAFGNPATNQLAARVVHAGRHGIVTGVKQSGVQVGAFLAGVVLPGLAGVAGWRTALGGCAVLGGAGLVLTVRFVPGPSGSGEAASPTGTGGATATATPAAAGGLSRAGRRRLDRAVNRLTVYALLMGFGVGAVGAYLPLYAVEELGFSRGTAGLTAALMGLVGVIARVGWGRRHDRTLTPVIRSLGTLAVGSVAASGALWAAASLGSGIVWAGAALFGGTAVAWNALGMLAIVRDVDVAVAGRASGRVLLGFYVGFLAGPISFGWSVDHAGYAAGWAAVTGVFVVASALTLAWIWKG